MQISSRFTLALHILACIDAFGTSRRVTSSFLAGSTHVNPVVVRRILGQLKDAGIVEVARGTGGATIERPLDEITFFDVYEAVGCLDDGKLFHFHENPDPDCPVGGNIHAVLDGRLNQVQLAMERELKSITFADVSEDLKQRLKDQHTDL